MKHNTNPIHLIDVYSFGYEKADDISVLIPYAGMDERHPILYNVIEYHINTHESIRYIINKSHISKRKTYYHY